MEIEGFGSFTVTSWFNAAMSTISLQDLQEDPTAMINRIEAGETLRVLRGGRAVAELRPVVTLPTALRPVGLCAGEFTVPDDFDAPLPEEILREFEGS
ncbi:hypothetical protein BH11PLA2_BH11PLA2_15780 [soil metagenome]